MSEISIALSRIQEESSSATAYFHTWWALRNLALPAHRPTMESHVVGDFFHAASTAFLKSTFVSLAKLFDPDQRALGVRTFKNMLVTNGHHADADFLTDRFAPYTELVRRVLSIRDRSVSHNEVAITRDEVYKLYGVTPDEIRDLITTVREALNELGRRFGAVNSISDGQRSERAALALLVQLKRGASVA